MFLITLFFAFSVNAAPIMPLFPAAQCPAIGDEYGSLLAKLDTIKSSIKEGANCANVTLKVKSLEDLIVRERQKVIQIVEAGRTAPLSPEQTEQVRQYTEDLTQKVAALYDLFTGSNKCFRDDNAESGLASLAGFVGEASRLAAGLTGPWGTPIALGGHVVAGFLTGLDKVMKSRAGYDFSKPENWKNYVQNLCTFHSYRDQIDHLLNPQGRLNQLRNLKSRLDISIGILSSRCEECQRIEQNFDNQSFSSPEVLSADQRFSKPFGTYMLYSLGIRRWVLSEISRVERESSSFWADVSGRHLLSQARADLQQFLIEREAPRFLGWQTGQSSRDFQSFQGFALNEGRQVYDHLYYANRSIVTAQVSYYFANPLDLFRGLVVAPLRWELAPADQVDELKYAWSSFRDRSVEKLRTSEASLQVVQGFCAFFRQAGYYSSSVKNACTGVGVQMLARQMNDLDVQLAAVDLGASTINPMIFDPASRVLRGPQTPLESLGKFVDQMNPN